MLRRAGKRLERKIGLSGDFLAEWSQVFEVKVSGCGGDGG